jgi:phospholipase C
VFRQPHPGHAQGYLTPFHLDTSTTSAQATPGTDHSWASGEPIGLGFRVPAVVVSPWSAGGRVCSDVLDHTSLIRVIENG